MGSTWTTIQKEGKPSLFDKNSPERVYLQFVPGVVLDVATSSESAPYSSDDDINSIIAKPHVTNSETINFGSMVTNKYKPLLRGMVDVPVKGDPVLLCTFGDVNYYLGPLNTENNPNFNKDSLGDLKPSTSALNAIRKGLGHSFIQGATKALSKSLRTSNEKNMSQNFPLVHLSRLQKD